jgi:hypothetical protein
MTHTCFGIWDLELFKNSDPIIYTGLGQRPDLSIHPCKQTFCFIPLDIPELLK